MWSITLHKVVGNDEVPLRSCGLLAGYDDNGGAPRRCIRLRPRQFLADSLDLRLQGVALGAGGVPLLVELVGLLQDLFKLIRFALDNLCLYARAAR